MPEADPITVRSPALMQEFSLLPSNSFVRRWSTECVIQVSCALSKGHSQVEEMISKLLQNKERHSFARHYTKTLGATGADGVQGEDVWQRKREVQGGSAGLVLSCYRGLNAYSSHHEEKSLRRDGGFRSSG